MPLMTVTPVLLARVLDGERLGFVQSIGLALAVPALIPGQRGVG